MRALRLLVFGLLVLAIALALIAWMRQPAPNGNALALGAAARVNAVEVAVNPPRELDFLPREEVFDLRRAVVAQHRELLAAEYTPSAAVFGQIEDRLPWWGLAGQFLLATGEPSITGPSEETRFLLNPYLLAAADLYAWQFRTASGASWTWEQQPLALDEVASADFPIDCPPDFMRWEPRNRAVEVVYPVTECAGAIGEWADQRLTFEVVYFDVIAYNARDFNLKFIYIDYDASSGVVNDDAPDGAYLNPQFIHRGGSCGYPGGCNNMSPRTPEIDQIALVDLPATLVIRLWRDAPRDVDGDADVTVRLGFE